MPTPPAPSRGPASDVRVFLIDDQSMIRAGVKSLLKRQPGIEVVGDEGDARSGIAAIREVQPDVVLLDITMPGLSGLDAIGQIRDVSPRTRVVMLTHHEGQSFVEQALRAGADGYLSKDSSETELALAVNSVCSGNPYVSPRVSSGLVDQVRGGSPGAPPTGPSRIGTLTKREREVFQLLAIGKCNKEVASELDMSLGTAKKHRENLQRKLDCHSAAELARLAIREGLLST